MCVFVFKKIIKSKEFIKQVLSKFSKDSHEATRRRRIFVTVHAAYSVVNDEGGRSVPCTADAAGFAYTGTN